ncbi:MAG: sulfur oxidation c-type cytochrome SoxX [Betaproteobacteria bacterium]
MRSSIRNALLVAGLLGLAAASAQAQTVDYKIEGDGIPKSLTGKPGNAARGKALLAKRGAANCLSCHTIKDKELQPGGTRGPSLDGVGAALTPAQLRLSVVDMSSLKRDALMPSFHKSGVVSDKPTLSAEEVEDLVAYLATLKK